ncbi:MAG: VIT and VWA domain-containing protein [Psychromonas sp.]
MTNLIFNRFKAITVMSFTAVSLLLLSLNSFATGLLTPINSSLPQLEIKEHHVNVVIEDGYAITNIEQVFYNPSPDELEAKYSFPVPSKAAVGEFTYWIDGKPVTGEVVEKTKARKIYQQEKKAGRATALTGKNSYKNFESLVYPVRAHQEVRIKLVYIQPAHVDTSIGRYVYPLEDGGTDTEKLAFWSYNNTVTEKFTFKLLFRSSYPVEQFRLPKHPNAKITKISAQEWSVELINDATVNALNNSTSDSDRPTKQQLSSVNNDTTLTAESTSTVPITNIVQTLSQDIVVYWRHQANLPGRVELITHKEADQDRGTFMMTLTPGDDLATITTGRDWIFVLDYSGSMQGKYQSMVEGVKKGLAKLNPEDRFRIITFSNHANEVTNGFVNATESNVEHWSKTLFEKIPSGSTNLYDGIKHGLKRLDSDRSSALVLVTDGVANVGFTQKKQFLNLLEQYDVRLFTFVMGNSTNRPLLESMVKISNGFAISVSNSDDIVGQLMQATSKLTHQAFHDIEVEFSGIKTKDITPGKIASLYRGQQLIIMGHYWGDGLAHVTVKGKISGQNKSYKTRFNFPNESTLNPEIERLWAYSRIEELENDMDYFGHDSDTEQAITDLAIDYGLVTNYTSLIVMRDEQFSHYNIVRNNQKRVSNEHENQQRRQVAVIKNNRVDRQQPMYKTPVANHSSGGGGGSFGFGTILFGLSLLIMRNRSRVRKSI